MTSRRRVLTILAGAATLPVLGTGANALGHWQGIALGAKATIVLDHPDAQRLISMAVGEIHRLEQIFSLYRADSQLSRLNRDGFLADPAFELVELLSICSGLHSRTGGAFDPTVQALWSLYAQMYAAGETPNQAQIAQALQLTGWQHVRYSSREIQFEQKGVALTLNGIAQGFVADKIVDLFRRHGVGNALVNTGEIAATGKKPNGDAWRVRLGTSDGDEVMLQNSAVATSAPLGTYFDPKGKVGHILDPRTGLSPNRWSGISVISESAAKADGLSTAFCLLSRAEIDAAKGRSKVFIAS